MAIRSRQRCVQIEYVGDVTVVKFRRREILDVGVIEDVGDELFKLVQQERRHRLLINLVNIDRLSTAMVGKFVAAHQRAKAESGRLAFCGLDPSLREVFELLHLTDVFQIYENEQQGLEALAGPRR